MREPQDGFIDVRIGAPDERDASPDSAGPQRRWIGIYFACCGVYARVYRDPHESCYRGACPRCRRSVQVPVGPHGTSQRLFRAE
ncbi:MAG: hypothetical protein L6R00_15605 [Phycisphaerae bacterium]|nr:hypothetical protein [Phycisphaerae bacterium]